MTLARHASQDYPERDRVAILLDVYAAVERVEVDLIGNAPPETYSLVRTLPNLTILNSSSRTDCNSRRTRRHVGDGKDDLVFTIITGGAISFSRNGADAEFFEPGDACLGFNDRPSEHRLRRNPCFIEIVARREMLAPRIADLDAATGSKLPRTPELRLLTRYAHSLTREFGDIAPDAGMRHAAHVHDLIAMVVGAKADTVKGEGRDSIRATRIAAIKADIAENITAPCLTIQSIAAAHGISPQYVRSLFNSEGTTFGDYLLNQRLALAHARLSDPGCRSENISDIAFGSGFGDLSYFNRTFRRRYGLKPTEVREAAAAGEFNQQF